MITDALPQRFYRLEFAKRAELKRDDERRIAEQIKKDKQEKGEGRDKRDGEEFELLAMATDIQIEAFTVRLDAYDAATTEALLENEEARAALRRQMEEILGKAYVLPDGRRVFKTEDGLRVFDESGQELSAKEIDPDVISRDRPTWETYRSYVDQNEALTQEHSDLIAYQARLDTVHERLDAGDITADELKSMDAQLRAELPDSVNERLPENLQVKRDQENEIAAAPQSFQPTARLDMPAI